MIYFDTSALAKKYFSKEKGRNKVIELLEANPQRLVSSALTHLELISALTRRREEISAFEKAEAAFNYDWETFIVWAVDNDILDVSVDLIRRYKLKAADAIHLATSLSLRSHTKEKTLFVTSDHELLSAANREGLLVMNPETA